MHDRRPTRTVNPGLAGRRGLATPLWPRHSARRRGTRAQRLPAGAAGGAAAAGDHGAEPGRAGSGARGCAQTGDGPENAGAAGRQPAVSPLAAGRCAGLAASKNPDATADDELQAEGGSLGEDRHRNHLWGQTWGQKHRQAPKSQMG